MPFPNFAKAQHYGLAVTVAMSIPPFTGGTLRFREVEPLAQDHRAD